MLVLRIGLKDLGGLQWMKTDINMISGQLGQFCTGILSDAQKLNTKLLGALCLTYVLTNVSSTSLLNYVEKKTLIRFIM